MRRYKRHLNESARRAPAIAPAPASTSLLQRHGAGSSKSSVPLAVGDVLRSSGQPLDQAVRASMEPRFGHDFSRVRVHTDSNAASSAAAVNASAYTVGQHIVFGGAGFNPHSAEGRRLLAHELTHVVQQDYRGFSTAGLRVGDSADPAEVEADRVASEISLSGFAQSPSARPSGPVLQRDEPKQARIDVAIVLDEDSNSMAEAGARAKTVLRVTSVKDAKEKLQALGVPIGTLYVISHANRDGEVEIFSEIGTISWVSISDFGSGLKGALPSELAPVTVDFRGCKIGEAGSEMESFRKDIGATEAVATNCWTFTQEATPIIIDGAEVTEESQIPENMKNAFNKNLLDQVAGMTSEDGTRVGNCLIGLARGQKASKKNLPRIKELYFGNQGRLVASWASPDFNKTWQKGSRCSKDVTTTSKPCGLVKKVAPK